MGSRQNNREVTSASVDNDRGPVGKGAGHPLKHRSRVDRQTASHPRRPLVTAAVLHRCDAPPGSGVARRQRTRSLAASTALGSRREARAGNWPSRGRDRGVVGEGRPAPVVVVSAPRVAGTTRAGRGGPGSRRSRGSPVDDTRSAPWGVPSGLVAKPGVECRCQRVAPVELDKMASSREQLQA